MAVEGQVTFHRYHSSEREGSAQPVPNAGAKDGASMLGVLTLNIWNITEPLEQRMSLLIAGLNALKPDIVCLQEVSPCPAPPRLQSEILAQHCGFAHHRFSLTGHWENRDEGLAVLSRYPIARTATVALPEFPGDRPRQVLFAEIEIESCRTLIANTHLAYALHMTEERKSQVLALNRAIGDYRKTVEAQAVLICGDFNDQPDSPAIRAMLDGEPERFDAFASCNGGREGHTFTSENPYVDGALWPDWRVDYIFGDGALDPIDCRVVFDGNDGLRIASDHFGVFCMLRFK
jgi:endonuclease/exonuclease/phosphatase family metal-dependent hydrolase